MKKKPLFLVISCEHAGNVVPKEYTEIFRDHHDLLQTHRGIDIGALELTEQVVKDLKAPVLLQKITRLLVDCNRTITNPSLFSEVTKNLACEKKEEILDRFYWPYREKLEKAIKNKIDEGYQVIHLSMHTFTPVWKGKERSVDIGFLFDPERESERVFIETWMENFAKIAKVFRFKKNAPYRGTSDGLTKMMRCVWPSNSYIGIELEVSQRFASGDVSLWKSLQGKVATSLSTTIDSWNLPNRSV